ncbi:hypothetical protein MRB53_039492 [Persea americana]|nr:hypothetical protein MRB53_039492 [Persea americana]
MHIGLGSHSRESQQQRDAREARQIFKNNIRSDWSYPSAEPSINTIAGFKIHADAPESLLKQVRPEAEEWLERVYASSDSEYYAEEQDTQIVQEKSPRSKHKKVDSQTGSTATFRGESLGLSSGDYLFEGPDTVGDEVKRRQLARRNQRQKLLAEEMQWNVGLDTFIKRRDAWTGARTVPAVRETITSTTIIEPQAQLVQSSALLPSPRTSTSSSNTDEISLPSRPSTAATSPDPTPHSHTISTASQLPEMLIPRMSRLLTVHPIRRKIGPSMYTEIYSKIITQSRTPSVPINLLNLTRALVQGWKNDGEWPPAPNPPEPAISRKKGAATIKKAVTKVLKITTGEPSLAVKEKDKNKENPG